MSVVDHAELLRNVAAYHEAAWQKDKERYDQIVQAIVQASREGERFVFIRDKAGKWLPDLQTLQHKLGDKFTCEVQRFDTEPPIAGGPHILLIGLANKRCGDTSVVCSGFAV